MDHFIIPPDAKVHDLVGYIWNKVNGDILIGRGIWDRDGMIKKGDASVPIGCSFLTEAKDVLSGTVRAGDGELTEEAIACLACPFEANIGDLTRCGMDLVVIVAMDFRRIDGRKAICRAQLMTKKMRKHFVIFRELTVRKS